MAYKQKPGRSPLEKTGRDIPLNMKSPAYMTDGPGDNLLDSVKKDHPNKTVKRVKGNPNKFKLIDQKGNSVSLTRHASNKKDNSITVKEAVQTELLKNKKK